MKIETRSGEKNEWLGKAAALLCLALLTVKAHAVVLPILPQKQVDTTMPPVTGSTLNATCATLQAQINAAAALNVNLTHRIILATGAQCTGPYKLASHTGGTGWILITGPNMAGLPAAGTRVGLGDAANMPQIKYGDDNVAHVGAFSALTGAQRYRIIGIDMVQNSALDPNWAMVATGNFGVGVAQTGYIILDRVIMRDTDPSHRFVRAVLGESELGNIALIDSYVAGFRHSDTDTQAFLAITNPGPILVLNNFLEASGENVMFCGGTPVSEALMPRDITIQRNTFSKNAAWFGLASGTLVKTLIELKCGVRVLIEGNDFLNMPGNDAGNFFRFTVRNESGLSPYAEVADVTFRHNLIANVCNGVNMFGSDDQGNLPSPRPSKHVKRVDFSNNLFYGLGANCLGLQGGRFFALVDGGQGTNCTDPSPTCKVQDLTIRHNTVDDVGDLLFCITTNGEVNLDWKDNVINGNSGRGIFDCGGGSSSNYGATRLSEAYGTSWNWTNNHIALSGTSGESTSVNPQGTNVYPTNASAFLWTNRAARDYSLSAGSPAKNSASDGTDRGVDFAAYNAARAGTTPPPPVVNVPPSNPKGFRLN